MIPMDGPVGDLIRAQGRHGFRPAHIHFLIGSPGYREVVTALYLAGDDHIDSDTVFGVTDSLVAEVGTRNRLRHFRRCQASDSTLLWPRRRTPPPVA